MVLVGYSHWMHWTLFVLITTTVTASADTFSLKTGGVVKGVWNNPKADSSRVEIETASGIRLTLPRAEVREIRRTSPALAQYQQLAPRSRDTVEDHWQLAEYCRKGGLVEQRQRHLLRIIQMQPNHAGARRGLAYRFVQGKWMTENEYRLARGYTRERGKWQTNQQAHLDQERDQRKSAQRQWGTQIDSWMEDLIERRSLEALRKIQSIQDPLAALPIMDRYRGARYRPTKLLLIDALHSINSSESRKYLVEISLWDRDKEVFHEALNRLTRTKHPDTTSAYIDALKTDNNAVVNRAATALRTIGDSAAVPALIDALITTHKIDLGNGQQGGDAISTTFASQLGSNGQPIGQPTSHLSTGKSAQIVEQRVQNDDVLHALTELTGGVTFGYNLEAWSRWYAIEAGRQSRQAVGARRE